MELLIMLILGIGVGYTFTSITFRIRSVGALRVDRSDPSEPPYLFLELTRGPEALSKRKYVVLDVKNVNFISHE